jgi:hypothetical protein
VNLKRELSYNIQIKHVRVVTQRSVFWGRNGYETRDWLSTLSIVNSIFSSFDTFDYRDPDTAQYQVPFDNSFFFRLWGWWQFETTHVSVGFYLLLILINHELWKVFLGNQITFKLKLGWDWNDDFRCCWDTWQYLEIFCIAPFFWPLLCPEFESFLISNLSLKIY